VSTASPFRWPALLVALALPLAFALLPAPGGLSVAGWRVLGVLAGAVVLWISEAVSYAVSAVIVTALLAVLVGFAPPLAGGSGARFGTAKALSLAADGFRTSAVLLVSGALFLSAAMKRTGLDRRIALVILSRVGSSPTGLLIGLISVAALLACFVPSTTARAAALVPIVSGVVTSCALPINSRLGVLLIMTVAHASTIWNVGIKTAAAQNLVGVSLIEKSLGRGITWWEWFREGAPWAAGMTVVLFVVMRAMVPVEPVSGQQATQVIAQQRSAMGMISRDERRLLLVSVLLLAVWATEGVLHPLDSATAMVIAVAVMLLPGIGVLEWSDAERLVPWGTIVLFGAGVSLGGALIDTGAAAWVARASLGALGVSALSPVTMLLMLAVLNILVHLGFASATGLAAAILPIMLAFFDGLARTDVPVFGMSLVQLFMVSVGFVLPVNSPQNMVCQASGAFTTREFVRVGVVLTIAAVGVTWLMGVTWWQWGGLLSTGR
jgi:solute carrier family 13 (sodium-dependent dicarboxylate transporter), member 2/3/5